MECSYGYIETYGYIASIVAADAALKTADVTLTNCYFVKGGRVTIEVIGDVAAVKAAVEAGSECAKQLGNFISNNVIARVDEETKKILFDKRKNEKQISTEEKFQEKIIEEKDMKDKIQENVEFQEKSETEIVNGKERYLEIEIKENTETEEQFEQSISNNEDSLEKFDGKILEQEIFIEENQDDKEKIMLKETIMENGIEEKSEEKEEAKKLRKKYQSMKVTELKKEINDLKLDYTWNQIKGMNKKKLIEILIKSNQEE